MSDPSDRDTADFASLVADSASAIPVDVDRAWDALRQRHLRRRRARRIAGLSTLLTALVLVGWGVVGRNSPQSRKVKATATTAVTNATATTVTTVTTVAAATGPAPPVRDVLTLPQCPAGDDLAAWASGATASFGVETAGAAATAATLDVVAASLPVPVRTGATCGRGLRLGPLLAYELRDGTRLVARATGTPWPNTVPEQILGRAGNNYEQSWIGSGQSFNGSLFEEHLEAVVGTGSDEWFLTDQSFLAVIEYDPALIGDASDGIRRQEMLARLRLATLVANPWAWELPGQPPAGYVPCSAQQFSGEHLVIEYCDESDEILLIRRGPSLAGAELDRLAVGHRSGRLLQVAPGRHALEIDLDSEFVSAEAPTEVAPADLAAMLDSVPVIDAGPVRLDPDDPDYRASLSDTWVADALRGAGGIDVQPARDTGTGSFHNLVRLPGEIWVDVVVHALEGEHGFEPAALGDGTTVQTVQDHDVFVRRDQVVLICRNVIFNVLGPTTRQPRLDHPGDPRPALELVDGLLRSLDC